MNPRRSIRGSALLEGLLAVLIFSIGVLALIGMQANSINAVSESKYRTDAAFLANQLIGQMWVAAPTSLPNYAYSGSGNANVVLTSWLAQVNATLPDASANPSIVAVVSSVLGSGTQYTVTVTIRYRPPKSTTVHRFTSTAVVS